MTEAKESGEAIRKFIPALEERVEQEISEVEEAILELKKTEQDSLDDSILTEEELDTVKPVIEQEIEPNSYNHASYKIEAHSGKDNYETHYKPAEVQIKETDASYACTTKEREMIKEGQRIQQEARMNNMMGRTDPTTYIDTRAREVKEDIKLRSMAMWYLMYEGVQFC